MVITNVQDRKPRPSVASSQLEGSRQIVWRGDITEGFTIRSDVLTTLAGTLVPNSSVATLVHVNCSSM
jgi:hypothetical protein